MKLKSGQLPTSAQLKGASAMLVYGSDLGAIEEAVQHVIRHFKMANSDLELIEITPEKIKKTPSLFSDEVNAYSMLGQQRLIYYKNVPDSFVDEVLLFLREDHPNTFLLMSSSTLKTTGALCRQTGENERALAVGCYPQEAAGVKQTILSFMTRENFVIHPDAVDFLTHSLGADKAVTMGELEKIKTYMGPEKQISLKDVQACIGNETLSNMDELIVAAMTGNARTVRRNLKLLTQENVSPVTLVAAFIRKAQQIMQIILKRADGVPLDTAISGTPPYISFAILPTVKNIVSAWPVQHMQNLLALLEQTDKQLKSNLPADIVLNQMLLRIIHAGKNLIRL